MSPVEAMQQALLNGFPRLRGDEPNTLHTAVKCSTFSPPTRG